MWSSCDTVGLVCRSVPGSTPGGGNRRTRGFPSIPWQRSRPARRGRRDATARRASTVTTKHRSPQRGYLLAFLWGDRLRFLVPKLGRSGAWVRTCPRSSSFAAPTAWLRYTGSLPATGRGAAGRSVTLQSDVTSERVRLARRGRRALPEHVFRYESSPTRSMPMNLCRAGRRERGADAYHLHQVTAVVGGNGPLSRGQTMIAPPFMRERNLCAPRHFVSA